MEKENTSGCSECIFFLSKLTGNSGGAVYGTGHNINILSSIDGLNVEGNPATSTLTINSSSGQPLFQSLTADSGGTIHPDVTGDIDIKGGTLITTKGVSGYNSVTCSLDNGLDGQVIIGSESGPPSYAHLTSSDGSVTITNGPNSIDLSAPLSSGTDSEFFAFVSSNQLNVTGNGSNYTIIFDTEKFDTNGDFDTSTGRFTAPVKGLYRISATVNSFTGPSGIGNQYYTWIEVGGTGPSVGKYLIPNALFGGSTGMGTGSMSFILDANDAVEVHLQIRNSAVQKNAQVRGTEGSPIFAEQTYFSGNLIKEL